MDAVKVGMSYRELEEYSGVPRSVTSSILTNPNYHPQPINYRKTTMDVLDRTLAHQRLLAQDDQASKERLERLKQRLDRRERRVQPLRDSVDRYMYLCAELIRAGDEQPRDFNHEIELLGELKVREDTLHRVTPAVTNSTELADVVAIWKEAAQAYVGLIAASASSVVEAGLPPEQWFKYSQDVPAWQHLVRAAVTLDDAIDDYIEGEHSRPAVPAPIPKRPTRRRWLPFRKGVDESVP